MVYISFQKVIAAIKNTLDSIQVLQQMNVFTKEYYGMLDKLFQYDHSILATQELDLLSTLDKMTWNESSITLHQIFCSIPVQDISAMEEFTNVHPQAIDPKIDYILLVHDMEINKILLYFHISFWYYMEINNWKRRHPGETAYINAQYISYRNKGGLTNDIANDLYSRYHNYKSDRLVDSFIGTMSGRIK